MYCIGTSLALSSRKEQIRRTAVTVGSCDATQGFPDVKERQGNHDYPVKGYGPSLYLLYSSTPVMVRKEAVALSVWSRIP